jgi:hypothetical protein
MRSNEEIIEIRNECLENLNNRKSLYNFFLSAYESEDCENLLKAHLDEVVSLIYLSENVIFDYYKSNKNEPLTPIEKEFRDIIQDRFYSDNIDLRFYDEVLYALIFGNQFLKIYPTGKHVEVETVFPYEIGVRYTTIPNISDPAQAVCHIKYIPYDILRTQYSEELINEALVSEKQVGLLDDIVEQPLIPWGSKQGFFFSTPYKNDIRAIMNQRSTAKFVEVHELWIWEEDIPDKSSLDGNKTISDYYVYTIINDTIVNKGLNPCIEGRLPFVNICLNPLPKSFWGMSELHYLVYLQEAVNKNQKRGDEVMELLARPPMIFSGITSSEVSEENEKKLHQPGAVIDFPGEDIKMEPYLPQLNPEVAYQIKSFYEQAFEKISGLNETLAGRAQTNVRSASQQGLLAMFASAPLKKKALRLESAIEEAMLLYAQSYQVIHSIKYGNLDNYRIKVNSHSTSPITQFQYMNILFQLTGAGIVPPKLLIQLLPIPRQNDIIQYLEEKEAMQTELIKEHPELLEKQMEAQMKGAAHHGKKK